MNGKSLKIFLTVRKTCCDIYLKHLEADELKLVKSIGLNDDINQISNIDERFKQKWLKRCNGKFKRNATLSDIQKYLTISNIQKAKFMFYSELSDTDSRVVIRKGNFDCPISNEIRRTFIWLHV
jgi:transcription elongation factor GreA-like protein